jgi:hypothetical protein
MPHLRHRGLGGWGDGVDGILKSELDGEAGEGAGSGTGDRLHDLYTSLAHWKRRKCMVRRGEIVVQKVRIGLAPGTGGALQKGSPLENAQRGWQISGEVVVPAAQS